MAVSGPQRAVALAVTFNGPVTPSIRAKIGGLVVCARTVICPTLPAQETDRLGGSTDGVVDVALPVRYPAAVVSAVALLHGVGFATGSTASRSRVHRTTYRAIRDRASHPPREKPFLPVSETSTGYRR